MESTRPENRGATPQPEGPDRAEERAERSRARGCLKGLLIAVAVVLVLVLLIVVLGKWYLGTDSFREQIRQKVESTLEDRLGRDVSVHDVQIAYGRPWKIVLNDLRIANAKGTVNPYFATVRQVDVALSIRSIWGRTIDIGRVDVIEPHLYLELSPTGDNNAPHWKSGPPSQHQLVQVNVDKLYVANGGFDFLDRKHQLSVNAVGLGSEIKVTNNGSVYAGVTTSPRVRVAIQDYVPFDLDLRGGFRYTQNGLTLSSVALNGRDMKLFLAGKIDPLSDGVYNLRLTSKLGLERVRQIFKVDKTLTGTIELDGNLRGKQGEFALTGGWISPRLHADAYELTNIKGRMNVTGERVVVDVDSARYGGGTIGAHYLLPGYAEPYPMSVELRYDRVSLEKLFSDWGVNDTGLRGDATGKLAYHWEKDRVLAGAGAGIATLSKDTTAFSNAKYALPLTGAADFTLDNGVVTFRKANLQTDASQIAFTGTLRIEDIGTDLKLDIQSHDFAELDRAAYNFAQSAGKKTFTLLGLGGSGNITGTVQGPIKTPQVAAHIGASDLKYNNVVLGNAFIDLRYDGVKSLLTFEHSLFRLGDGSLDLAGTIGFPDQGPSPRFDLAVEANNYPVERAIGTVDLHLAVKGMATGKMVVTGTSDSGKVTFADLSIKETKEALLKLNGDLAWMPGKGNLNFDLGIDAEHYPIADVTNFLEVGAVPVTGELTGSLHLQGPKNTLEGTGSIKVENGSLYGEPVTSAAADVTFTKGTIKATNLTVTAPAGTISGEGEVDLNTNKFSYTIQSSSIDLNKVKALSSLLETFGGHLSISSTGAGTFTQPEIVLEATLNDVTVKDVALPGGELAPKIYLAIRDGQLIVKGGVGDLVTVDGTGSIGNDGTLSGNVKVVASDIAKILSYLPATTSLPAAGNFELDLQLGGKISSLEALRIDATVPVLKLRVSEHEFTAPRPLRLGLRNGRIVFDDFEVDRTGSSFSVSGYADLTGSKELAINVRGSLEAALLQLALPDLRADGHINIDAGIRGTLSDPRITGTAELQDTQMKFAGFPQLIDHMTGTLVFRGDRIDIDSLKASVGGGTIVAGGTILTDGLTPKHVRISLQGNEVAIRYFEGVSVEGNFNLLLNGDLERMSLTGDVDVTRATYYKDFDFGTSLLNVLLSRRGVTPVVAASWQDKVDLRLHMNAPGTLAVRNNIADVTGTASVDITGTLANPIVLGLVTIDEGGKIRFQNVDYRVVRGSINFQNPFRIDPYFDITVEGRISTGFSDTDSSGPIDVTVNITGTLDRITPTITSDPPTSDITLFSILGLGGLGSRTTTPGQNAPDAALAGRSLLYQSLGSLIGSKILPFADSVTYDPGLLDASSDPGPKVTFEKRVSNTLRVIVVYNLQSHRNRELIEWQINPDWTLQFTRDETRNEYRLEARFRRQFEGHWAFAHARTEAAFASLGTARDKTAAVGAATPEPFPPLNNNIQFAVDARRNINTIDFRADGQFDTSALPQEVALRVGQPLTVRDVQTSIKSLFASGDFRDIRVDAVQADTGVAVTFYLYLNFRIDLIEFEGLHGKDRERAEREVTIRTGDVLSLNAVDHGAVAVQQLLNREGYLEATVDPETNFIRERGRANVILHVVPGPRATIAKVTIEGDVSPYTPEVLIKQMRRGPGRSFNVGDARSDADRMRTYMVRRDHRKADVRFLGQTYDATTHGVTLRYRATAGPIVKVAVNGVSARSLRSILPFRRTQAYSEDVIDRASDAIISKLQADGYFNAAVDTEEHLDGDTWITTFNVNPGARYKLTKVTFTGNAKLSEKTLRGVVVTAPTGGFHGLLATVLRRPTGVTRTQLSSDRDAVESYYRLQGFSTVTVATPVASPHPDGTLTVDFPITEGPQTLVTDVTIEGNSQVQGKTLPKLQLKVGAPLNPTIERQDVINLQAFYGDRGNAEVQVKPREEITADKTGAKITYAVSEGPQINVGQIVVRGNTYTKTSVVLREAELKKGSPFSYTSILEAQRNLYRLGIFQRVDIQPEQAGTAVDTRNVVVQVEEGKDLLVAGSLGISKQTGLPLSPLSSLSLAHRNLFGTGRYLGLELVYSDDRHEAFLTFREPFIGKYNIPVQFTVFQSDQLRRDAHIRQRGTFVEATKVSLAQTRWSIRYEYKIGDCIPSGKANDLCTLAREAILPGLDRSLTNIRISSVTPTFFWDKRDDAVDPHRGFLTSASVEYAFPLFTAKTNFFKEFAQASYYIPVSTHSVFAFAGRVGLIQPLGNSTDSRTVPLSERFVAGGDNSNRAFPVDLLGTTCADPRDGGARCQPTLIKLDDGTIAPIGGDGLVLLNAEYRFPIVSSLGGALFLDAGNVYAQNMLSLGNLRYGLGTGIRYVSPVGPIRFDVGYNLKRRITGLNDDGSPKYEKPFSYFITLGYAF